MYHLQTSACSWYTWDANPFHVEHIDMHHLAACQVCASSALREVTRIKDRSVSQESFEIVACAVCGAWFTSPRPGPDSIGAYYQSTKYISHTNASTSFVDRIYQLVRKRTLASKHRIISSYRTNGRLLDIGCGTGQFALFMKRKGYQVSGVEPDAGARSQASTILEHTVHASIEVLPSGSNYDLITMWHVLEHVPDLQPTFASLNHLLAPGGHLLLAIPDRESWDARHYAEAWAAYDVPRHLSHLRRQDLRQLLDQHGFELLRIRPMYFDAYYIALLSEQYKGRNGVTRFLRAGLVGTYSNLVSWTSSAPTSSTMYIARKL